MEAREVVKLLVCSKGSELNELKRSQAVMDCELAHKDKDPQGSYQRFQRMSSSSCIAQEEIKSLKKNLSYSHHVWVLPRRRSHILSQKFWPRGGRELLLKEDWFKYSSRAVNYLDVLKTLKVQVGLGIVEDDEVVDGGSNEDASKVLMMKLACPLCLTRPTPLLRIFLTRACPGPCSKFCSLSGLDLGLNTPFVSDVDHEIVQLALHPDHAFKYIYPLRPTEISKMPLDPTLKIHKNLSRMKRFNAQEALEYRPIDRILRPARVKADAPRKEVAGIGLG
ncbi:uncharacterized protein A4U43_C05F12200 [Asparagus officinalis]|uniref:Uncharacterized protein n=1 Tax=Asparagus officinalis TaxID=4686 RepID=A0A5P1ES45_ASPOF|nr:uncharacterized protein A4U43_C05F12200 [Asparagus officinalis]